MTFEQAVAAEAEAEESRRAVRRLEIQEESARFKQETRERRNKKCKTILVIFGTFIIGCWLMRLTSKK